MKRLSLLGSTGSIGESTLEVVDASGGALRITVLCAGSNIGRLAEQARKYRPELVVIADSGQAQNLRRELEGLPVRIAAGEDGVMEAAAGPQSDVVLSAVVGAAGILPAWHALRAGKDLALANKETLVAAGEVIMETARQAGRRILPVDSEHCSLSQILEGRDPQEVRTIFLTASGGPFWADAGRDLWEVVPEDALRHPSWSMGEKVTIDSATLMNKGLEVIEARWLFDVQLDRIGVLIHPQSIVHAVVGFIDGSMMAHLSRADMRLPIAAALYHPAKAALPWKPLDLIEVGKMEFHPPDDRRFPALALARKAQERGGAAPAVLNAANEVAVEAFLRGSIRFPEIIEVSARTMEDVRDVSGPMSVEKVLEADTAARGAAGEIVGQLSIQRRS